MKKSVFFIALGFAMISALSSCKNDVLDQDETLEFSKLPVEEQKHNIEQNGIVLMTKMEEVQNTKAMIAMQAFNSNVKGANNFTSAIGLLRTGILKNDLSALETFNQQMRVAVLEPSFWGVWTWNNTLRDFIQSEGPNNSITFKFPATANSIANSGELKITYVPSNVAMPFPAKIEFLPQSISIVLKVNEAVALTANFQGVYKSDATPIALTQTLVIDQFNWKFEFANNDKNVSSKYSFNYNSDVLLKYEIAATGSLTKTEITDKIKTDRPQDIFTSCSIGLQVMNIALFGGVEDFKSFSTEMDANNGIEDKARQTKVVGIMNKYMKIYGYFVAEKSKFADVEFYLNEYVDTDTNYDPVSQRFITVTLNKYSVEPRLVLSDGSKVDIKNFFTTGFEDLVTKLNTYQK